MNKIAIIGHGPSMSGSNFGTLIDSYDIVVRQKAVSLNLVNNFFNDFGRKTSIICGSYTIKEALFWHPNAKVWVFTDSRHEKLNIIPDKRFILLRDLCDYWNSLYRSLRTDNYIRNEKMTIHQTSSNIGHNHMSCGMHTIIYACEIFKPSSIDLFGFDNVKTGNFTWSLTRGESWNQYPDHRWDIENKMLNIISQKYSVEFKLL